MTDDTLAGMFWRRIERSGARPAQLVKRDGRWHTLTWSEVGDAVRELGTGLLALGHRRGESVVLLSASRAEWVHADMATLIAGGVTVPIYPTYPPELVAHIVNDSGARFVIVENRVQLDKVVEVRGKAPALEHVVLIDGPASHASNHTWNQLRARGREHMEKLAHRLTERTTAVAPEDVATIVYTSGTTGLPKGVVQTHANHMAALAAVAEVTGVQEGEVHLLFLPLAHSFARLEAFMGVHVGLTTAFAESVDAVATNLREVRPHFFCSVPRLYEKVHERIIGSIEAARRGRSSPGPSVSAAGSPARGRPPSRSPPDSRSGTGSPTASCSLGCTRRSAAGSGSRCRAERRCRGRSRSSSMPSAA